MKWKRPGSRIGLYYKLHALESSLLQTARAVVAARVADSRRRCTGCLGVPWYSCGRGRIASDSRLLDQHRDRGTGCEFEDAVAKDYEHISDCLI